MKSVTSTSKSSTWRFKQCFGEQRSLETIQEEDMLTAVEFSPTGDFIATGDRAGRVVIFEQIHRKADEEEDLMETDTPNNIQNFPLFSESRAKYRRLHPHRRNSTYKFQADFQSHKPDFDCLKSLEIEEKINKIKWCKPSNDALFLLTTNDKTIKLWKVSEQNAKVITNFNSAPKDHMVSPRTPSEPVSQSSFASSRVGSMDSIPVNSPNLLQPLNSIFLKVPKFRRTEKKIRAQEKRVFANAHAYHINSIAAIADNETYLSSDDLRVNLWHLSNSEEVYNIVDIKPDNMDELTEVITGCEAHPANNSLFIYSSSRGTIKMNDLREKSNCDKVSKLFDDKSEYYRNWVNSNDSSDDSSSVFCQQNVAFFSEILASISDIKFAQDGRHIISRDYLTIKIWDVNKEDKPVEVINFLESLKPQLKQLYRNDSIFDKFEVACNADGTQIVTGSYENRFFVFDKETNKSTRINVSNADDTVVRFYGDKEIPSAPSDLSGGKDAMQVDEVGNNSESDSMVVSPPAGQNGDDRFPEYRQKALHLSIHPEMDCLAVAVENNLYIYGS